MTKSAICDALPSEMPMLKSSRFLRAAENEYADPIRIRRAVVARSSLLFSQHVGALEITAEGQIQIHALAEAGGADLSQLDFCREVFPSETQDGEHIDLALVELLPAELHRIGTTRNCVAKRAFAFM